ncbi:D-glycero-beta-D-manno-heptose-7-phosphate kinase [Dethiosulfatarculus sandiegensis]|uniref:D-glycero-beta-D-manno-heptose-7-phosphate kinase n=1 Tax=Dethiosulfatarculus sandiegensis TaxID=1429043 RepID=UPI0005C7E7D4|nr:D-glycero-beta-D-manno-heptose-7-phosphate kinase [Dethiosulfatarculus sandiegensis]
MNYKYSEERLAEALEKFSQARVLVLGDVMLDRFIWGSVGRISPEAPVPVVQVESETHMLGGAANVLHNIIALGGNAVLCGVVGTDHASEQVCELLGGLESETTGLLKCNKRPTTVKTRVVAHSQQVVRVDRENRRPLDDLEVANLCRILEDVLPKVDAVIVSDYAKGVINPKVVSCVAKLTKEHDKPWVVDPKVPNISLYKGATLVTPNHVEALQAAGVSQDLPNCVQTAGLKLLSDYGFESVLVTQGEKGMTLFSPQGEIHIPTAAKRVFDVTGAGDTVISTLTLGMVSGLNLADAAVLANLAAGVVVGEVGTSAVTAGRLLQALQHKADA